MQGLYKRGKTVIVKRYYRRGPSLFPENTQGFITTSNLSTLQNAIQLQSKSKIYNYNSSPVP